MEINEQAQRAQEEQNSDALKRVLGRERERPRIINGVRICLDCEEPIPLRRIEINPEAVRCVTCQAAHEKRAGIEGLRD